MSVRHTAAAAAVHALVSPQMGLRGLVVRAVRCRTLRVLRWVRTGVLLGGWRRRGISGSVRLPEARLCMTLRSQTHPRSDHAAKATLAAPLAPASSFAGDSSWPLGDWMDLHD